MRQSFSIWITLVLCLCTLSLQRTSPMLTYHGFPVRFVQWENEYMEEGEVGPLLLLFSCLGSELLQGLWPSVTAAPLAGEQLSSMIPGLPSSRNAGPLTPQPRPCGHRGINSFSLFLLSRSLTFSDVPLTISIRLVLHWSLYIKKNRMNCAYC